MWDREQTFESMCPHLLEEADEVVEAIEEADNEGIMEELGDLLLHVVFLSRIGEENSEFTIDDVIKTITAKIKRRHPHVFGDLQLNSTEEILGSWERIKQQEKDQL